MKKISVFQLIDLDRTLFDTPHFIKVITDEINKDSPGLGTALDKKFEAAYAREETFFVLRFLRQEKGDAWLEALVQRVVAQEGNMSFLLPGAHERLAFANAVSTYSPGWGIFTYGDEVDQYMKMRIVGLEAAPVYFTTTPDKSEVIASWKTTQGAFQLPEEFGGGLVGKLTLEDDKYRAFVGLPEGVLGLWVTKPHEDGNAVKMADSVYMVESLFESVEKIKEYIQL